MTAAIWFWIIYVLSILFSGWCWWPFNAERAPSLVLYILIGLLGWGIFGPPIR